MSACLPFVCLLVCLPACLRSFSVKLSLFLLVSLSAVFTRQVRHVCHVVFPGKSQLQQSRATQPTVRAGCFSVSIFHRTLTWTKVSQSPPPPPPHLTAPLCIPPPFALTPALIPSLSVVVPIPPPCNLLSRTFAVRNAILIALTSETKCPGVALMRGLY